LSYSPTRVSLTRRPDQNSAAGGGAFYYDSGVKSPKVGKQRSASGAFSLSRSLPKLKLPVSAPAQSAERPRPRIGKPSPGGGVKGGRNG